MVDGEIVIDDPDGGQDFDALQQRIHPAKSRIEMLASETPSRYVAFDLLAFEDESWLEKPFAERRAKLEALAPGELAVTPLTTDPDEAEPWLRSGEGVVAKDVRRALPPGRAHGHDEDQAGADDRRGGRGVPPRQGAGHGRLADPRALRRRRQAARGRPLLGSEGRREAGLASKLAPYETGERGHGDPSRWKSEKELEWIALRPELVVEVTFDHASGGRIRHGTKILRWREDKPPLECKLEQMSQ